MLSITDTGLQYGGNANSGRNYTTNGSPQSVAASSSSSSSSRYEGQAVIPPRIAAGAARMPHKDSTHKDIVIFNSDVNLANEAQELYVKTAKTAEIANLQW